MPYAGFVSGSIPGVRAVGLRAKIGKWLANWLTHEEEPNGMPLCDFERLTHETRPCDVLLVEGRSRVSYVIKTITQSIWTHSALYIGRIGDIDDEDLRRRVLAHYPAQPHEQLLVEPLLGRGTVITSLEKYHREHIRICRPKNLESNDAQAVIRHAIAHLGTSYDFRQLLDLGRFMLPYAIIPRRWRSTLFEHNAGIPTKTVCSTMITSAFSSVHYPIRPVIHRQEDGRLRMYKRNARLSVPSDYDYSPYFEIVKYPVLGVDDIGVYRQLPWDENGVICNSETECFLPGLAPKARRRTKTAPPAEGKIGNTG